MSQMDDAAFIQSGIADMEEGESHQDEHSPAPPPSLSTGKGNQKEGRLSKVTNLVRRDGAWNTRVLMVALFVALIVYIVWPGKTGQDYLLIAQQSAGGKPVQPIQVKDNKGFNSPEIVSGTIHPDSNLAAEDGNYQAITSGPQSDASSMKTNDGKSGETQSGSVSNSSPKANDTSDTNKSGSSTGNNGGNGSSGDPYLHGNVRGPSNQQRSSSSDAQFVAASSPPYNSTPEINGGSYGNAYSLPREGLRRKHQYAVDYEAQQSERQKENERSAQTQIAGTNEDSFPLISETQTKKESSLSPAAHESVSLSKGTRIPMELVDPFQSGISAMVRAQTTAEIKLPSGRVIPRGAEVYLPMLELAVPSPNQKGRVVVDPRPGEGQGGFITLRESEQIPLKGTAYGEDRLAGLPGKRHKVSGGQRFGALKRVMGRAAAQAAGQYSPIPTGGIEYDLMSDAYRYEPISSQYVVNVEAGIKFTFVVGL